LHPGGQQPSPLEQLVILLVTHLAVQTLASPIMRVGAQASPGAHVDGQAPGLPAAMARSQLSPGSTSPLPQVAEQSGSLEAVQPAWQH
jgi:hypothetical protein